MKAIQFIINTLKQWEVLFPGIIVKYSYEEMLSYHIITVEPGSIYLGNQKYVEEESRFWDEFHERFPEDELVISEPNCCLEMTNQLFPEISVAEIEETVGTNKWFEADDSYLATFVLSEGISRLPLHAYSWDEQGMFISNDNFDTNYSLAA